MRPTTLARPGLALAILALSGCTMDGNQHAKRWVAEMDSRPAEERVPNWDEIRVLMMREAPRVGDAAPDFALETCDRTDTIRLSALDPNKPVVLIFGSWT